MRGSDLAFFWSGVAIVTAKLLLYLDGPYRRVDLDRVVKLFVKNRQGPRQGRESRAGIATVWIQPRIKADITVDIQRRGLSREQIKFVQQFMLPLKNMGLIEPEEERHQWVFHVMVSGRYTEWRDAEAGVMAIQQDATPTLATNEVLSAQ